MVSEEERIRRLANFAVAQLDKGLSARQLQVKARQSGDAQAFMRQFAQACERAGIWDWNKRLKKHRPLSEYLESRGFKTEVEYRRWLAEQKAKEGYKTLKDRARRGKSRP